MAYIKLNEVELVDTPIEPNILIEVDGEIQRMPAKNLVIPQAKADWGETDPTKSGYILNKPESLGSKVITFTEFSGSLYVDDVLVTKQSVLDEWNAGSILRLGSSNVLQVSYVVDSGILNSLTLRFLSDTGALTFKTIY